VAGYGDQLLCSGVDDGDSRGDHYGTWGGWLEQTACTTNATITSSTWATWNANATTTWQVEQPYYRQPTPNEIAQQQEAHAAWARQANEEAERRVEANARAEALLRSFLTPDQIGTYDAFGYIEEQVGERLYRINKGSHGNVSLRKMGSAWRRCVCSRVAFRWPTSTWRSYFFSGTRRRRFVGWPTSLGSVGQRNDLHIDWKASCPTCGSMLHWPGKPRRHLMCPVCRQELTARYPDEPPATAGAGAGGTNGPRRDIDYGERGVGFRSRF
jgi:hypothetical protein